jgi:hypothetical protein
MTQLRQCHARREGRRRPIPTDQRATVPADIDSDDAASTSIRGRSWIIEGTGGLTNAPVLRKTAETLEANACLGAAAVVDRVWFQTDIAMFAATEFATFSFDGRAGDVFPDTLLPVWTRTVRDEFGRYAVENLLQVEVLSSLGVRLADGPRIVDAAARAQTSNEAALAERLAVLAQRAGVTVGDAVPDAGPTSKQAEPVFRSSQDTPWGPTEVDVRRRRDRSVSGCLFASTGRRDPDRIADMKSAMSAGSREAMANKLIALDRDLTVRPRAGPLHRTLPTPSAFRAGSRCGWRERPVRSSIARLGRREAQIPAEPAQTGRQRARPATLRVRGSCGSRPRGNAVAAYHIADDGRIVARSPES